MRIWIVLLMALVCSGCGACRGNPLQKEFAQLNAERAINSASAEQLYNKAEEFVERLGKSKNPPEKLLAEARTLQQQRAREFARAAARDWNFGSAAKVFRALRGSRLNVETEAEAAGIDPGKLLPKVDPTADTIPPGWK